MAMAITLNTSLCSLIILLNIPPFHRLVLIHIMFKYNTSHHDKSEH